MSRGGFRTPPVTYYETLCKSSKNLEVVNHFGSTAPETTERASKSPLILE